MLNFLPKNVPIAVFVLINLCTCSYDKNQSVTSSTPDESFCQHYNIKVSFWAKNIVWNEGIKSGIKYGKIVAWDEYIEGALPMNPIAENIDIGYTIDNFKLLSGFGFHPVEDIVDSLEFSLSSSIQFKLGLTNDCLDVKNFILSEDFPILENKRIYVKNFFNAKNVLKTYFFKVEDFPLKKMLKDLNHKNYKLNQLIVKTKVFDTKNKQKCYYEYIHPICVNFSELYSGQEY